LGCLLAAFASTLLKSKPPFCLQRVFYHLRPYWLPLGESALENGSHISSPFVPVVSGTLAALHAFVQMDEPLHVLSSLLFLKYSWTNP
jgi:hypothetical protein